MKSFGWVICIAAAVPGWARAQEDMETSTAASRSDNMPGATISRLSNAVDWPATPFPALSGATGATTGLVPPLSSLLPAVPAIPSDVPSPAIPIPAIPTGGLPSRVNSGPARPSPTTTVQTLATNAPFPASAVRLYARECMAATAVLLFFLFFG